MKVAIYGGTFDPLHSAHKEIIKRLSGMFDKVFVVPTTVRYYKKNDCMFSFNYRFEEVLKFVNSSNLENVDVLDIEREVSNDWRFIDTLKTVILELKLKLYLDAEVFVAMGSDSFSQFTTWTSYKEILDKSKLVVFHRPGHEKESFPAEVPTDRYIYVEDLDMDISSTTLRAKTSDWMDDANFEDYMCDVGWATDGAGNPLKFDDPLIEEGE